MVITSAGSAFSAGGDLAFLQELPAMPQAIRSVDKPVVAAVNGAAVGAGCEITVAAEALRIGP